MIEQDVVFYGVTRGHVLAGLAAFLLTVLAMVAL